MVNNLEMDVDTNYDTNLNSSGMVGMDGIIVDRKQHDTLEEIILVE